MVEGPPLLSVVVQRVIRSVTGAQALAAKMARLDAYGMPPSALNVIHSAGVALA